jgi:23S rRNA (guanosine2251-2'-O)-methyltransferase
LVGLNIGIFIFLPLIMGRKLKNDELNRLSGEALRHAGKNTIVLILDNIRSLHNVGSAFRTADAFRIEKLMLCGLTGQPPHREIEKTALGATSHVDWQHYQKTEDAIAACREKGYRIYAVEQAEGSIALQEFQGSHKTALIFGNEVYGVEQSVVDASDGVIEIPQLGAKHSLNVSVSIGVVLWEILRESMK